MRIELHATGPWVPGSAPQAASRYQRRSGQRCEPTSFSPRRGYVQRGVGLEKHPRISRRFRLFRNATKVVGGDRSNVMGTLIHGFGHQLASRHHLFVTQDYVGSLGHRMAHEIVCCHFGIGCEACVGQLSDKH